MKSIQQRNREKYLTQYRRRKTNPYYKEKWKRRKKVRMQRHYFSYLSNVLRYKYQTQIFAWDLWKIAKRQKMICPLTNRHLTRHNISIDHIIPTSKGGTNDLQNLRFVDYHANLAKATFSDSDLLKLAIDIVNTLQ